MSDAKQTVKVHYTGKFDDGTVFDSSEQREPLEFTIGENQVIPGFEHAVIGMILGELKTVTIPADEAYGPYRPEMVISVHRDEFPDNLAPEIGQRLQVRQADGQVVIVTVTEIEDEQVKLDANHPLAGRDLIFDIELVDVDKE